MARGKNKALVAALRNVERRLKALCDPLDTSFSPGCTREERVRQAEIVRTYVQSWVLPKVESVRQVLDGETSVSQVRWLLV